jgi:hypothetical protein
MQALLAGVDGVIAVPECRVARAGGPFGLEPIRLCKDEIAIGRDHEIVARSAQRGGA